MRLVLGERLAIYLGVVSITFRIFAGVVIYLPELLNAGWISVLIGALLCAPMILLCCLYSRNNRKKPMADALSSGLSAIPLKVFAVLSICVMVFETAVLIRLNTGAASYASLYNTPSLLVALSMMLVSYYCVTKNGLALGSAAKVWIYCLPWLAGLVILLTAPDININWLAPILGNGVTTTFAGGIKVAGWLSTIVILWVISEPETKPKSSPYSTAWMFGFIAVIATLLIAFNCATTPPLTKGITTSVFQLDRLFSNGKTTMSLQMPMIIVWFINTILNISMNVFLSAKLLQLLIPKLDGRLCVFISAFVATVISQLGYAEEYVARIGAQYEYLLIAAPFFIMMLFNIGGVKKCAA